MNHCHDCNSTYAEPGTCNCFAVGGKRHGGGNPWVAPTYPSVPYVPGTDGGWGSNSGYQCPLCGGFYIGSHSCGTYNPHIGPTWCTVEATGVVNAAEIAKQVGRELSKAGRMAHGVRTIVE